MPIRRSRFSGCSDNIAVGFCVSHLSWTFVLKFTCSRQIPLNTPLELYFGAGRIRVIALCPNRTPSAGVGWRYRSPNFHSLFRLMFVPFLRRYSPAPSIQLGPTVLLKQVSEQRDSIDATLSRPSVYLSHLQAHAVHQLIPMSFPAHGPTKRFPLRGSDSPECIVYLYDIMT